jgi:hypothetical protein
MTAANPMPRSFVWKPIHIILIVGFLQLLITLLTDGFALSFDEAMWHYIGRDWFRHGLTPYSGGVDNKSPLIFAIFGFSDWLFGVNYWFPRLLGTVIQSVGIYYLYLVALKLAGRRAGMITIVLYGLSLLWRSTDGKLVSLTETYAITFIILAFYLFLSAKIQRDYFLSGLISAIGLGFRLSAGFGMVAILLWSLKQGGKKQIFSFCLGLLTGCLLLAVLVLLSGISLNEFIRYAFLDNFGAGSATDHSPLWRLEGLVTGFFYSELLLFLPGVLAYFLIKKKSSLPGIWFICEFIGLNIIGIYARAHFKNLLPSMSLMSAISITYLIDEYKVPAKPVMIILWISFFPKLLEPLVNLKKLLLPTLVRSTAFIPNDYAKKEMGFWVKAHTAPDEKVLVAGFGAIVQAYSERISPSIYFNATQTKMAKERFFSEVRRQEPAMVLVPASANYQAEVQADVREFVDSLVSKDYELENNLYGYRVYSIHKGK